MEGNLVVDGVLASCYPSSHHDMAHIGMTPVRWLPKITGWVFGEESGFSIFIAMAENIGKWVLPFQKITAVYY